MKEWKLKKCEKCNSLYRVMKEEKTTSCCCGELKEVKPNTTDAAFEKHVPTYKKEGKNLFVSVNHVMEEEHFIEWVTLVTEGKEETVYFTPEDKEATCQFTDVETGTLYAYCNKHGLWMAPIE